MLMLLPSILAGFSMTAMSPSIWAKSSRMCLLAAVMMSSGVISADILDYCTVGMVGVATLMSGIISSRITGSAGLAVGSLTGFFIFLVITSIALIFNGEPITILTLLKLMSSVLGGGIGGIIGVNKKEKIKIR